MKSMMESRERLKRKMEERCSWIDSRGERGWGEVRHWCDFHGEAMSCRSDNKLQMGAVSSPFLPVLGGLAG